MGSEMCIRDRRELFYEIGVDESCHPIAPPPPSPAKEEAKQRHDHRGQPQNLGMFKMHKAQFRKRAGTILAQPSLGHAKICAPVGRFRWQLTIKLANPFNSSRPLSCSQGLGWFFFLPPLSVAER